MQLDVISWFLLTLFIGVFADKRLVKQGSLVCLFQNVTADNANKDVSLYVNGVNNPTRIVTFTFVNGHISMDWNPHMADNYSKIFMDPKRNICIANIDETYEGKFKIFSSTTLGEVELTILKTNYSRTERAPQKETTQKGDAVPETSYSTTERTALQETTQKGDALPDRRCSDTGYAIASIVLLVFVILMVILIVVIMKKDHRFAWILCKKSNSVPQPVQVTSHRDSRDSTSYQLMWYKPDDGGSRLIKYIIRYCEVEIIPDRTEYELSKYLKPFESVDNILPSVVSYELSPLTPGRYYLVEIQAIYTQGQTLKSFIFKTKEGAPKQIVEADFLPVVPVFQLPVQHAPCVTSPIVTDETNPKLHRLSKKIEMLQPRNNDTVFTESIEMLPPRNNDTVFTDTQSSTSNVEQNTNIKSKKTPEEKLESHDSDSDYNDEQDAFLKDPVD